MEKTDGVWFILERFHTDSSDTPLQQRVLHIHGVEENLTEMRVFVWKDPRKAKGLWKNLEEASKLSTADLRLQRGCEMYLQRDATSFFGGTHGMACSYIPGTSYTSISVRIADQGLALWERGYSADNKQIFGSEKGPYYYLKQKP
jgi:CpeT protein